MNSQYIWCEKKNSSDHFPLTFDEFLYHMESLDHYIPVGCEGLGIGSYLRWHTETWGFGTLQ
jgi:hypothetical protein